MRTKLLTLRFHASLGGFDARPLDDFIADKALIGIREHFFVSQEVAYLACLITYEDAPAVALETSTTSTPQRTEGARRKGAPSMQLEQLTPTQHALFQTLREWRAERARRDGIPPYVILTNREMLAVVTASPASPTELATLPGIGPAKTERRQRASLRVAHSTCSSFSTSTSACSASTATRTGS